MTLYHEVEISVSTVLHSTPSERARGTHWRGGCLDPRTELCLLPAGNRTPIPRHQSIFRHYGHWVIPVAYLFL